MDSVCKAFDIINKGFGANRISLVGLGKSSIAFNLDDSCYVIAARRGGVSLQFVDGDKMLHDTLASRWLEAIANGRKRNEKGEMV